MPYTSETKVYNLVEIEEPPTVCACINASSDKACYIYYTYQLCAAIGVPDW